MNTIRWLLVLVPLFCGCLTNPAISQEHSSYTYLEEDWEEFWDIYYSFNSSNTTSPLRTAINYGYDDIARYLISTGVERFKDWDSCASDAIRGDKDDLVYLMHEYGVNFQICQKTLEAAIARGNLEMFYFVLEQNTVLLNCSTFLTTAVAYSHNNYADEDIALEMINKLVDLGGRVSNNLLFTACTGNSKLWVVQLLLELGVDVNAVNRDQDSALMMALSNLDRYPCRDISIVKLLLHAGADPNINYPFDLKAFKRKRKVEPLCYFGGSLLTMCNSLEAVTLLLEHSADPERLTGAGYTPLYCAVWNNNKDKVKILLEYGADPLRTTEGQKESPLAFAKKDTRECSPEIVRLMLEHLSKNWR